MDSDTSKLGREAHDFGISACVRYADSAARRFPPATSVNVTAKPANRLTQGHGEGGGIQQKSQTIVPDCAPENEGRQTARNTPMQHVARFEESSDWLLKQFPPLEQYAESACADQDRRQNNE